MKHLILSCMALMLAVTAMLTSCSTTQYVRKSNPDRKFTVENIPIHVRAQAEFINPIGYPQRPLPGSHCFIEVINDKAYIDLPYVGRIYTPTMSWDGTCFSEPYNDLVVERNKKNDGSIMKFSVEHENITYDVRLDLWDGGNLEILITPHNGQSCNYSGTWDESQLYDKNGNPIDKLYY